MESPSSSNHPHHNHHHNSTGHLNPNSPIVEDRFLCPISGKVMKEPVRTSCGHIVDKSAFSDQESMNDEELIELCCPVCQSIFPKSQLKNETLLQQEILRLYPTILEQPRSGAPSSSNVSGRPLSAGALMSVQVNIPTTAAAGSSKGSTSKPSSPSKMTFRGLFQRRKSVGESNNNSPGGGNNSPGSPSNAHDPNDDHSNASPTEGGTHLSVAPNSGPKASNSRRGSFLSRFRSKPYARLVYLNDPTQGNDLTKDEYFIGRSSQCEIRFRQVEVSGRHCRFFKTEAQNSNGVSETQVFIEDFSTNGTYVNGIKIARETPVLLHHLDEISLGRKFTSEDYPVLSQFIDVTFYGLSQDSVKYQQIQSLKTIAPSFSKLLTVTESELQTKYNITNSEVRLLILRGLKNWSSSVAIATFRFESYSDPRTDDALPSYNDGGASATARPAALSPPVNLPDAGATRSSGTSRRASFFKGLTEVSFSEQNYYAKVSDGTVSVEISRKSVRVDDPLDVSLVFEDEAKSNPNKCFITEFPVLVKFAPRQDKIKVSILWDAQKADQGRQVFHFTLAAPTPEEKEYFTFKRHKMNLTLETDSWLASMRQQQIMQQQATIKPPAATNGTANSTLAPGEVIPTAGASSRLIHSSLVPTLDLSDVAVKLLSSQFLDLDQMIIKQVLFDIAKQWDKLVLHEGGSPLELHIWVSLAHLTLLDFKFQQFRLLSLSEGKKLPEEGEAEEEVQFNRFLGLDLSDYSLPGEVSNFFTASAIRTVLIGSNEKDGEKSRKNHKNARIESLSLKLAQEYQSSLGLSFGDSISKDSIFKAVQRKIDVNQSLFSQLNLQDLNTILTYDIYSASRPSIFHNTPYLRSVNIPFVGSDAQGSLNFLIDSVNNPSLVDFAFHSLPLMTLEAFNKSNINSDSESKVIYGVLRDVFRQLDLAINNFLKLSKDPNAVKTGLSALVILVQPKRILSCWLGTSQVALFKCLPSPESPNFSLINGQGLSSSTNELNAKQPTSSGLTKAHTIDNPSELTRISESFGQVVKSSPLLFLPSFPPVSRSFGFPSHRPILSSEPEFHCLEVEEPFPYPVLIVAGTFGFWESKLFGGVESTSSSNAANNVFRSTSIGSSQLTTWLNSFYSNQTSTSQLPIYLVNKVTELSAPAIYSDIGVTVFAITPPSP